MLMRPSAFGVPLALAIATLAGTAASACDTYQYTPAYGYAPAGCPPQQSYYAPPLAERAAPPVAYLPAPAGGPVATYGYTAPPVAYGVSLLPPIFPFNVTLTAPGYVAPVPTYGYTALPPVQAYSPPPAYGYRPATVVREVPAVSDAVAYCLQRFRSYDVRTGTYLGYDGYRHPCP
jgi:BA14K-like protein